MCWIWVPSVIGGEFQDVSTPLCPGLWYKVPLYTSPKQLRGVVTQFREGVALWSSAGRKHHPPPGIRMEKECSKHSDWAAILPNEINLRQTTKVSANPAACVGTSACPCPRSLRFLTRQQIQCLFSFLSASPVPGTLVPLPPSSPLVTEFISVEKRMTELIPV